MKIINNTSRGWSEVGMLCVFDGGFPRSKTRRGRVCGKSGEICPTIRCIMEIIAVVYGKDV